MSSRLYVYILIISVLSCHLLTHDDGHIIFVYIIIKQKLSVFYSMYNCPGSDKSIRKGAAQYIYISNVIKLPNTMWRFYVFFLSEYSLVHQADHLRNVSCLSWVQAIASIEKALINVTNYYKVNLLPHHHHYNYY